MSILSNPQNVVTTKLLVAADALDAKYIFATIADRDATPIDNYRYHGMEVFVQEDSTKYILSDPLNLTNTGWKQSSKVGTYKGLFDPTTPPTPPPKDADDINFIVGDNYVVDVPGFWNFTTGDQSPDSGGQHVENLLKGEIIRYEDNSLWTVAESTNLVTSVNGEQGIVVLNATKMPFSPAQGLTATQTQAAIEEVKIITDGLSSGSVYKGVFNPNASVVPPPKNNDDANFDQADFFQVNVAGVWNFVTGDQTVDGNEVSLTESDIIRYNAGSTWDVIPFSSSATPNLQEVTDVNNITTKQIYSGTPSKFAMIEGAFVGGAPGLLIEDGGISGTLLLDKATGKLVINRQLAAGNYLVPVADADYAQKKYVDDEITNNVPPSTPPGGTVYGAAQFRSSDGTTFLGSDKINVGGSSISVESGLATAYIGAHGINVVDGATHLGNSIVLRTIENGAHGALILGNDANPGILLASVPKSLDLSSPFNNFINTGTVLGIGTSYPNEKAILDVSSTTKGLLIPRMTTTQKDAMTLVAADEGMEVYDLTLKSKQIWDGAAWQSIGGGGTGFLVQDITHPADGALTIDLEAGNYIKIALGGNITSLGYVASIDGRYTLEITQDAVGGHNVDLTGRYTLDGALPDISVAANTISKLELTIAGGKNIIESMGNLVQL